MLNHLWYVLACIGVGSVVLFFLALTRWAWYRGSSAREITRARRDFRLTDVVAEAHRILANPLRDDGPMT